MTHGASIRRRGRPQLAAALAAALALLALAARTLKYGALPMFTPEDRPRMRWRPLAALAALIAAFGLCAATASAGTTGSGEVDETECPVFSSTDPNCTMPPPPGGEGATCIDPRLACEHGGDIGGGGGGGAAPAAPRLSVNDAPVTEGDSGNTVARFTVSLSSASTKTVTVDYSTADGTARAPADYERQSGTLTFAPRETSKTVTVPVVGDTEDERAEDFFLQIFNASNASIDDREARGNIKDNDLWVKVWTDAFIPRDIAGLTRPVPGGPHAGGTMIENPFPITNCALTNQRSFDNRETAPHKMQSLVVVDPKKGEIVNQVHGSDETIEVACATGAITCGPLRAAPAGRYTKVFGAPGASDVVLALVAAQTNPCVSVSPPIDYNGTLRVTGGGGSASVSYEGKIDDFPAFEMYATDFHSSSGAALFQKDPVGTPSGLFGDANNPVSGSAVVTSTD